MIDIPDISISREKAKEQFEKITKDLDIKHTFSFDEIYDLLLERRIAKKRQEKLHRGMSNIKDFIHDRVAKNVPGFFKDDPFPLVHTFSDGLYIRQVTVPANILTVTKIHAQEHAFFLLKGTISILTEEGVKKFTAPYQGITKVGTQRIIYHHDEVVFTTVHSTDKKTVEEVEMQVIANDFDEIEKIETQKNINEMMNSISRKQGELLCR